MIRPRYGLARVLSKRGLCSRSEAERLVREGRVRLDGRTIRDPEHPADLDRALVEIDGVEASPASFRYLMLNKPRGLVTTLRDERGRDTVYRCFDGAGLGHVAPVGRLDKASEGLLLFSNDPEWSARITDPATGPVKTYHVQVDRIPEDSALRAMRTKSRSKRLTASAQRRPIPIPAAIRTLSPDCRKPTNCFSTPCAARFSTIRVTMSN